MQVSREMTLGTIGVSEKASFFVIMIIRASGHELCKSETFCFRMTMSAIYSPKMLSNPSPALLPSPLSHDLQTRCAVPWRRRGAARRYSLWSNLSYPTNSSFDLTRIFFVANKYSEEFESSASPIQRQFCSLWRVLPLKLSVDGVLVVTAFPTVFNILHLVVEA